MGGQYVVLMRLDFEWFPWFTDTVVDNGGKVESLVQTAGPLEADGPRQAVAMIHLSSPPLAFRELLKPHTVGDTVMMLVVPPPPPRKGGSG
jgi:hypothetical protein